MKQQLRKMMSQKPATRGADPLIQQRVMAQDWWACAFQVGLYMAAGREPRTALLLADLLDRGARIAVPMRRRKTYVWGWVDAETRWKTGAHGIREPVSAPEAVSADLRVILVPGVAFDAHGGRLGHGNGHYDRLLADSTALRVGLCYENRLIEAVPMEPHDIRMDVVVTEMQNRYAPTAADTLERMTG
jgi:5-formyltetrahydrofolate cyclo-ligase